MVHVILRHLCMVVCLKRKMGRVLRGVLKRSRDHVEEKSFVSTRSALALLLKIVSRI